MITSPPRTGPGIKPIRKEHEVQRPTLEPLSKREIDERIGHVMREVAAGVTEAGSATSAHARPMVPRWITPRELVERMQRFIVYN